MSDTLTRARLVRAPNPGPMTLEGTNTWVLSDPGATEAVVVDPGPADEDHLRAVLAAVAAAGQRVALVLLTHGHADHSGGARRFAELTGAPVRAVAAQHRVGPDGLSDEELITVDGLLIQVIATPGHTTDSVSFLVPADGALLTGDTVLGRGSTVVEHPSGRLADYLDSLRRLRTLTQAGQVTAILPGHGPVRADPLAALDGYLTHRAQRLDQVRAAVAGGDGSVADVLRRVYPDVPATLRPAAERSVRAQLDYLRER
jgi:glyoxylase-like metal-dependent hydrolase (beta-lactamase superfamily II)